MAELKINLMKNHNTMYMGVGDCHFCSDNHSLVGDSVYVISVHALEKHRPVLKL